MLAPLYKALYSVDKDEISKPGAKCLPETCWREITWFLLQEFWQVGRCDRSPKT